MIQTLYIHHLYKLSVSQLSKDVQESINELAEQYCSCSN
jgi:uncharacterized OsmC-like protein